MRKHLTQAIGQKEESLAYGLAKEESLTEEKHGSRNMRCWDHGSAVKRSTGLSLLSSVWDSRLWAVTTPPTFRLGLLSSSNSVWKHPHSPEACLLDDFKPSQACEDELSRDLNTITALTPGTAKPIPHLPSQGLTHCSLAA